MRTQFENGRIENSRVDQYVSELSKGLEDLSETRKAEELAEIRQHLEANVKACEELGLDEMEAQEEAVRQFGSARKVSGGLRKAYWREKFFVPDTVAGSAFLSVGASLVVTSLLSPVFQIFSATAGSFNAQWPISAWILMLIALLPQALAGYVVGRVSPRRGVAGTLVGKSALAVYFVACYFLQFALTHLSHPEFSFGFFGSNVYVIGTQVAAVALGVLGAHVGRRQVEAAQERA